MDHLQRQRSQSFTYKTMATKVHLQKQRSQGFTYKAKASKIAMVHLRKKRSQKSTNKAKVTKVCQAAYSHLATIHSVHPYTPPCNISMCTSTSERSDCKAFLFNPLVYYCRNYRNILSMKTFLFNMLYFHIHVSIDKFHVQFLSTWIKCLSLDLLYFNYATRIALICAAFTCKLVVYMISYQRIFCFCEKFSFRTRVTMQFFSVSKLSILWVGTMSFPSLIFLDSENVPVFPLHIQY